VAAEEIQAQPFVGVGLDLRSVTKPFGVVSYEYDVHNLVIGTWYKTGLVGLAGLLIAVLAIVRVAWQGIARSISQEERTLAVALLSAVAAFVAFSMSAPVLFVRYGWVSAAMVLALRAIQETNRAGVAEAEQPRASTQPALSVAR
jgi:O-antigen ligase